MIMFNKESRAVIHDHHRLGDWVKKVKKANFFHRSRAVRNRSASLKANEKRLPSSFALECGLRRFVELPRKRSVDMSRV